ncbi:MAG: bifunctional serine/threonine-protein kinase/formylglycine-generating enzyme family protein, partial [Candidatus Acidiferrales bacterium]
MANQEQFVEHVFGAALDLPPERRSAFLDQACREAPELRRFVEELLLENQRAGSFLAQPLLSPFGKSAATASSVCRELAIGTKLGRYSIVEPLGAGGMGVVYRAHDEKLDRAVAIKILAPGVLMGAEARHRFHKEALALAKLSHTRIAAVYDVGQQDGVDYIVMECVPGESLAAKLKSGPLTVKDATSISLQIAEALEEAHEHGVIHRDLKPANVMITPKGQAKVLDFGLAKLLEPLATNATLSIMETHGLFGTPLYMSPEQAQGKNVDARTDLWSLGVRYYESLTGLAPFHADSSIAILRAIIEDAPRPASQLRPDVPPLADRIVSRSLEKDPAKRYQSASEVIRDASELLARFSTSHVERKPAKRVSRALAFMAAIVFLFAVTAGTWLYHRSSSRHWAREEAIPQITSLLAERQPLAAFLVLEKAQKYLPSDPQLTQIAEVNTTTTSITSSPSGAMVEIQDYASPDAPWHRLGATPLERIRIPKGYFRWRVSKPGTGEMVVAPLTEAKMDFPIGAWEKSPNGMVLVTGGKWGGFIGFVGWLGPYKLPPYYLDRYEVTNRQYQKFVSSGGYEKTEYWPQKFTRDGHDLSWHEAMAQFRDTTGRPGPSTWVAGHYPEGTADFPVTGVSWFEASAYAAFAGRTLPVLAQWYQAAPEDAVGRVVPVSNISGSALEPVGVSKGLGPYGTYDMVGNVREWVANPLDGGLRFLLGGSWKSPSYMSYDPEALSPFDRSETNGFRCVLNIDSLPNEASSIVHPIARDFSRFRPVSDNIFHA